MMFYKHSAAIAAVAFFGYINASPCKPFSQSTATVLETSRPAQTSTIETSSATIELSSSATTELSSSATIELSSSATTFPLIGTSSSEVMSSLTLSFETSIAVDETTTLIASTTDQLTFETTKAITESLSEIATTTDVGTTTDAFTATTAYTTTDASTIESTTSSSAPQCTFTGEYTNYVQNPSFDNRIGSGTWYTTSPWVLLQTPWVAPNAGRTGSNAIAIKYPDGLWSSSILQPLEGVVAGRQYVVRYYWSLEGNPLQSDECRIGTNAGSLGQNQRFIYTDGEDPVQQGQYYMQEFYITADQDDQRLSIGFFCKATYAGNAVRVNIDDVSVYDYYEACGTHGDTLIQSTR